MFRQVITNFTTLVRYLNPIHTQCCADKNSLRTWKGGHEHEHKFGKCLSRGKFHSCNTCICCNAKRFKCDEIGHIQSVCNITVRFTATNAKLFNSDPIKWSVFSDHLFFSTISKNSIKSYSSPEAAESHNLLRRLTGQTDFFRRAKIATGTIMARIRFTYSTSLMTFAL